MSVQVDDVRLYELILSYLKKREEESPFLVRESPHFLNGDRKIIVQWISKLVKNFRIGIEAHHLAIFLFDFFIADHQADAQGLYLIGAACFSIASKVNDIEINVPQASKILRLAPFENVMQSYLLKSTEILVLQHFNWNVLKPTEASFLEYYAASCLAIELECIEDVEYCNNLSKYFNKWISYFREKVLLNDEYRDHRPSKVACAIVISTRISMSLFPEWPDFMVHLSGWYKSDFSMIVNKLRSGLRSDLLLEKYSKLYQYATKQSDGNQIIYIDDRRVNPNDTDLNDASSATETDDGILQLTSSATNISANINLPIKMSLEAPVSYFASTGYIHDNLFNPLSNSCQLYSSSNFSMNMSNSQSSLHNPVLSNKDVMLVAGNSDNQFYLSERHLMEYPKSIESMSTLCDLSLNVASNLYSSNESISNQQFEKSLTENLNESIKYQNPISDSISSSLYLVVSQADNSTKNQIHSKHSHSVVVEPISLSSRRSQNRDSIISNSVNNGYFSLKKRAPGLIINVNGGGSSYSLSLPNNCSRCAK